MTRFPTRLSRPGPLLALRTLAIGAAGAAAFAALGLPAPFLTGPAVAVSAASLSRLPTALPVWLRNATFVTLGVGIGASVTPEVIAGLARWPASLAALALTLAGIMALAPRLLTARFGFDPLSARLASTPGHLSYVIALSETSGGDTARVAMVQSMRILFLTLFVPVAVGLAGFDVTAPLPAGTAMTPAGAAASFAAAIATALTFQRLGLPAALLIGAMAASAALHGTGIVAGTLPPWLAATAFVVMGTLIGTRFGGQSWRDARASLGAGLAVTAVACALAGLAALALAAVLDLPVMLLLIAFAPGGVEAMAAMALLTGMDPAFVAGHHVARMLILSVLVPLFLRGMR